jgi:hypothetical protein
VSHNLNHRDQSQLPRGYDTPKASHDQDAHLHNLVAEVLQVFPKFGTLVRVGCAKDTFYGDEGEWTNGG